MTRIVILICGLLASQLAIANNEKLFNGKLKDLYFGEALYHAYQEDYFDAISRLDTELAQFYGLDEPNLNSLYFHIDHAEFSVGDFELYYRMHNRASRAIKAVIEGNVKESVRNDAIFRLAKIYYQKQQFDNALQTIEKLNGDIPAKIKAEEPFLRAQIYIESQKYQQAIDLLRTLESSESLLGYTGYNLGVALFHSGKEQEGVLQLDKVGTIKSKLEVVESMRDKANLVLGFRLLEAGQAQQAKFYLSRVRMDGPFSNKALLGAGWAAAADNAFDRALVPWQILSERNVTDKAVQEALLGVPYAYAKLNLHGKAAVLYGKALDAFSQEIKRLDGSITSIRQGKFLKAVIREELKNDKLWLINLRKLPETPETYYLTQLMASHDFQEFLKNYFDLAELSRKLETWAVSMRSFREMINIRANYYEPLIPQIEEHFRDLDAKTKLRIEQRDKLDKRLKKMLISPRPDVLITAQERVTLDKLDKFESALKKDNSNSAQLAILKIRRLRGVISWQVMTEYQERFTQAVEHLRELDERVKQMKASYDAFVRTRQVATQSYKGYDEAMQRLNIKIRGATEKVKELMARQGHMIEVMAIEELEQRRQRLEEYQVKARFAMAENYDRATKEQQEQQKQQELQKQKLGQKTQESPEQQKTPEPTETLEQPNQQEQSDQSTEK